ncbi:MAG: c-type cytochrome [Acidobacteriota bacterium]
MRPLPGLATTLVVLAFARLSAQAPAPDHSGQYAAADIAAGARVYHTTCVGCHGPTGAGVGSVDLRRGPLPRGSTDAALSAIITSGVPQSGMPAFRLNPEELRGVVAFIRAGLDATGPSAALSGDASRGRLVVQGRGHCLDCHRLDGRGNYGGPDLSEIGTARTPEGLRRSLLDPSAAMHPINRPVRAVTRDGRVVTGRRVNEDTYTVQLITAEGRLVSLVKTELRDWSFSLSSPMPSYRDTLLPGEIADLVAYLASLKSAQP